MSVEFCLTQLTTDVYMLDRNTKIPLYLAIRQHGSILNVNKNTTVYSPKNWWIADAVLTKLCAIYKVPCYRFRDVLYKVCKKYNCSINFMLKKHERIVYGGIGLVQSKNKMMNASISLLVRRKTEEVLSKRKFLPSGIELDLLHLKTEIKFLPQQIVFNIKYGD
jgi:hypothetical protein